MSNEQKVMSNVWESNILLVKADQLAHLVFEVTRSFPRSELYGLVSQLRRAALSVPLNVIEGYSRFKVKTHIQFLEIAFGSLKETHYLIEFCHKERYIRANDHRKLLGLSEEVEKMLFAKIRTLKKRNDKRNDRSSMIQ